MSLSTAKPRSARTDYRGVWLLLVGLLLAGPAPLLGFAAAVLSFGLSLRTYRSLPLRSRRRRLPAATAVLAGAVIGWIVGSDIVSFIGA